MVLPAKVCQYMFIRVPLRTQINTYVKLVVSLEMAVADTSALTSF